MQKRHSSVVEQWMSTPNISQSYIHFALIAGWCMSDLTCDSSLYSPILITLFELSCCRVADQIIPYKVASNTYYLYSFLIFVLQCNATSRYSVIPSVIRMNHVSNE